jgi:thioredoxin reductase
MKENATSHYDYLIIGAGPAGLQLGYYMEKQQRNYLILEAGETVGTFFRQFPRHRTLISSNKVHTGIMNPDTNLRWDWNSLLSDSEDMVFRHYSKKYFPCANDYVRYLSDFAGYFNLKIKYGAKVVNIAKTDNFLVLDSQGHSYSCKYLIIATGRPIPNIPPIPGIELTESYSSVSTRPQDFTNQRVMIVGKGNSGFETADSMIETAAVIHLISPTPVKLAWKTHYVGHLRAVNNNVLDTYELKSQNTIIDAIIEKILRKDGKLAVSICYTHANGQRINISVDRIIVCAGFRFDDSQFDNTCRPMLAINDTYPDQTSEWESTNIKDLYFAGTLMHMRDYKKSFSGFIHGFRYNIKALNYIFDKKYHNKDWPSLSIASDPESLRSMVTERVNTSSAMFQQPGFLCDAIVIPRQGQKALYYHNLPVDYVHDTELGQHDQYFLLTMEYGHEEYCDPFNIVREPDKGEYSAFIHPVIRHFNGNTLISEYHIPEDLENNWSQDMYLRPFLNYLRKELG